MSNNLFQADVSGWVGWWEGVIHCEREGLIVRGLQNALHCFSRRFHVERPENDDKDEQRSICELYTRNTKKRIKMSERSVAPKITKVDIKYQHQFSQ